MAYKATISFSGRKLSMRRGEVRDITDEALVKDLLNAGYVIELKESKTQESKPVDSKPKTSAKKSSKKADTKDGESNG